MANLLDEELLSPPLKALDTIYHALLMRLDKPALEDEYMEVAVFIINHTPAILKMNNATRVRIIRKLRNMKPFYQQFYQKGNTYYFVGLDGSVMSTTDPTSDPETWHRIATYNGKGYRRVRLQGKTFKVHRLVAEAFIENPDHLPYVLHKDGNRENNHYTNLEWSARQSNHPLKIEK